MGTFPPSKNKHSKQSHELSKTLKFLEDSITLSLQNHSERSYKTCYLVLDKQWRPNCATIGGVGSNSILGTIPRVLVYFIQELHIFMKLTKAGHAVAKGRLISRNF